MTKQTERNILEPDNRIYGYRCKGCDEALNLKKKIKDDAKCPFCGGKLWLEIISRELRYG